MAVKRRNGTRSARLKRVGAKKGLLVQPWRSLNGKYGVILPNGQVAWLESAEDQERFVNGY